MKNKHFKSYVNVYIYSQTSYVHNINIKCVNIQVLGEFLFINFPWHEVLTFWPHKVFLHDFQYDHQTCKFLKTGYIKMKLNPQATNVIYIYGAPILDVSRSYTTTHHSRQDSSGRVISSSQRPVPDNTRHSTTDKYPCPRWDSNPRFQQCFLIVDPTTNTYAESRKRASLTL